MALYFSTRSINLNAGLKPSVLDGGSQIAFVNATSTITTTQNDFLTKGFRPGRIIDVANSSSNDGYYTIASVTAGVITVVESLVDEGAAAATPTITQMDSASWLNMFQYCILCIYAGSVPTDINGDAGGTLLCEVTDGAGAFTPGASTNGLEFEFDAAGKIQIKTGQDWREDFGQVAGTAAFGIIYDNGYITGDDSVNLLSPRIMGTVGLSGSDADIIVTTQSVRTTTPFVVSQCDLTLPGQAAS